MNRRIIVALTAVVAVAVFALAVLMSGGNETEQQAAPLPSKNLLVRAHSQVFGPKVAPVTIVEFFDPACETCRAFYPAVKEMMADFPGEVRLVIRYAPLHQGSDEVVRLLEAARLQNLYEPVLEAILEAQPQWASHGSPNLARAWEVAASAGLDVAKARTTMMSASVTNILEQDVSDMRAVGATKTPTFFVNGKPLPSFGGQQLYDLIKSEVMAARSAKAN